MLLRILHEIKDVIDNFKGQKYPTTVFMGRSQMRRLKMICGKGEKGDLEGTIFGLDMVTVDVPDHLSVEHIPPKNRYTILVGG